MNRFYSKAILPALLKLALLPLLLGYTFDTYAQCVLICNQGIQVSLDPAGQAQISTQLITPNAANSCPGSLQLTLFNAQGQAIPNPLTCDYVGETITAEVKHIASGNFCTGDLTLVDALPPVLNCPDKFIFCNENPDPAEIGLPTASDNCTGSDYLDFTYFDSETALGCGNFQNGIPVLKRIDRTWTVTDEHGNSSVCLQRVWLKHIQYQDVTFPSNLDNITAPALNCDQDPLDLIITGAPSVAGIPLENTFECEFSATYSDQIIGNCLPASFAVIRTWTTIDFCNGAINNRTQIIKVEDNTAPLITPPDNLTIGTDGFTCGGSLVLPQAITTDDCSSITVTPSWIFGSGYGPFTNIPIGNHIITYTALDGCGNSSTATMLLTVEDTSPPQAICSSSLQLSLSAAGGALLNAGIIGVNSSDNCGSVTLEISRDAQNFAPQLLFTCSDIGTPVPITLKVQDEVGLENFCETEIIVRDFLKPVIQCPVGITLNCLQDYSDLGLTGQATASDNCGLQTFDYTETVQLDACQIGSVSRVWQAIDSSGNAKTCVQAITIEPVNTTTVAFPANVILQTCSDWSATEPDSTGWPVIGGEHCSPLLSVNHTDELLSGSGPFCYHILRHWKVVDHCIYNPNDTTKGIWQQTQLIDVMDHTAPELEIPADITLEADLFGCEAEVLIDDAFAFDCSSVVNISNDNPYAYLPGSEASGIYPLGEHIVVFTATDACGNSASKSMKITVVDHTAPVAKCKPNLTLHLQTGGFVVPDPSWFDAGSVDLCTGSSGLSFSIVPDSFFCEDIGLQPVTLHVSDSSGNQASCISYLQVLDSNFVCGGGSFQVEGTIRTPIGAELKNIPVKVVTQNFEEESACDSLGRYVFQDMAQGDTCILIPENNANWLNGLTTYDLVLISRHILGISPLPDPLKMIAADANRSNSITTFDIVQLRKLLLGILDSLPDNKSWRFIDSTYVFPNPLNPFSEVFPEQIIINDLNANSVGNNFVALKIGDVNDSSDPSMARNPQDVLLLDIEQKHWKHGEQFTVPLRFDYKGTLEGFQLELEFDPDKVLIESVDFTNRSALGPEHVHIKDGNLMYISCENQLSSEGADGFLALHMVGTSNADLKSAIHLNHKRILPEAYLAKDEALASIELSFRDGAEIENELRIFPNPTTGAVGIQNTFGSTARELLILDQLGNIVSRQDGTFGNLISMDVSKLPPGVYQVILEANGERKNGKLIKL
ncbi:MAG: T9SS type A sorting domain-containing protein [Lewinellaceae bacterium]|nr:T9SS type A sorting domain-containing protein [Saprospiraceae bacterium]MCB9343944.1 T9SS type A sorting domain-containing protein [Lewinellaceae bacterium]